MISVQSTISAQNLLKVNKYCKLILNQSQLMQTFVDDLLDLRLMR